MVLQIEALFFPWCRVGGKVYESLDDTPGEGWDELHAWVKSWGVHRSAAMAVHRRRLAYASSGSGTGAPPRPPDSRPPPGRHRPRLAG
ncbi:MULTISPECIES: hypothetical protein [Streptomyces]|uniref:hypothetical protein n=1 Tax=Streptomyces TaxID=1883 RepID=UPI0019D29F91|nr:MULTISPECIES: hypothetical protein [Streptomyces]